MNYYHIDRFKCIYLRRIIINQLKVFKALNNDKRLKIIEQLKDAETCACELIADLNLSQPTISHHMKILKNANLVTYRKDGKWTHYSINENTFKELSNYFNSITGSNNSNCSCKGE